MKNALPLLCLLAIGASFLPLGAQETRFHTPAEIRRAYDNGTRSYDGRPGSRYWQNTADYTIAVTVVPDAQLLSGEEEVVYYNNSPDILTAVTFQLYHDAFKRNGARRYEIPEEDLTDGVALTEVVVDGRPVDLSAAQRSYGLLKLALPEPLRPGERLKLGVRWSMKIPGNAIRAGRSDSTSFFIAYWYPQVAVYDDVFGWDDLPYNLQSEFYNGLANFDVTVRAPENFLVWATGELQNPEAVYPPSILERYRQSRQSAAPVMVVAPDDLKAGYRNRGGSWHFKASEVSDFAFALSDHYLWEAAAQAVGDRRVLVSSVYPVERAGECAGLTSLQQRSMKIFSDSLPGIPYPYPAFTTFVGTFQGGMEFPMMANNDAPRERVTVHEMFHTYFPMYVRTNEKRFAWMDEGWAAYVTAVVLKRHLRGDPEPVFSADAGSIQAHNGMSDDLPLMTPTRYLDGSNYFYHSYHLPAFAYSLMHQHLGDELFLKCFREYILRWAKKSPTPYDFFYTFENVSGQDLSWLWESWFFEPGYADVAVKSLKGRQLTVLNRGTRPVPVHVAVTYQNGQMRHVYSGAAAWQKKETLVLNLPDQGPIESVHLNPDIPDRSVPDNFYPPLADRYKSFPLPGDLGGLYRFQEFPATALVDWHSGLVRVRVPEAGIDAFLIPRSRTVLESLDGQITMELPEGPISGFRFKHKGFGVDFTTKRL